MKRAGNLNNRKFDPDRLWRLPAALSAVALLVLPCSFFISRYETGSFIRDGLAHLLALGACSCLLGLGLGLWIGARIRNWAAVLTAITAILVALAWWLWVVEPLIGGR